MQYYATFVKNLTYNAEVDFDADTDEEAQTRVEGMVQYLNSVDKEGMVERGEISSKDVELLEKLTKQDWELQDEDYELEDGPWEA